MGLVWRAFNELITPKPLLKLDNQPSKQPLFKTMKVTIGTQRLEIDVPCGFGMYSYDEYQDTYFNQVVNLQMLEYRQWLVYENAYRVCFFRWYYKTKFLLGKEGLGNSGDIYLDVNVVRSKAPLKSALDIQQAITKEYRRIADRSIREMKEEEANASSSQFELSQRQARLKTQREDKPKKFEEALVAGVPSVFYEIEDVRDIEHYYAIPLDEHHYLIIHLKTYMATTSIEGLKQEDIAHKEDLAYLANSIRFYTD